MIYWMVKFKSDLYLYVLQLCFQGAKRLGHNVYSTRSTDVITLNVPLALCRQGMTYLRESGANVWNRGAVSIRERRSCSGFKFISYINCVKLMSIKYFFLYFENTMLFFLQTTSITTTKFVKRVLMC